MPSRFGAFWHKHKWRLLGLTLLSMTCTALQIAANSTDPHRIDRIVGNETDEKIAGELAIQHLRSTMKSPSSLTVKASKLLATANRYYMFQFLIDAQNTYGARVRENYCVTIRLGEDRNTFVYNGMYAVQECGNPPGDIEIKAIQELNNWGKPIDPSKVKNDPALQ